MKILSVLFLLPIIIFSQKIPILYVAIYSADMNMGKGNKQLDEDFALAFNTTQSYFGSPIFYNYDAGHVSELQGIDIANPERYISTNGKYDVFAGFLETKIRYQETPNFNWQISKEIKSINGKSCQKATVKKYGRNWTAFFSKDYPFAYGPLKFGGLPGLIFELYDDNNDYHYTLTAIKKQSVSLKNNAKDYKLLPKKNYLKARENSEFSSNSYPSTTPEGRKETQEMMKALKEKFNNPIELKPLE